LLDVIESVPVTLWAAVLGSLLTTVGVVITNISNNKRHKVQLDHDSLEKEKDRKANLRHEVYLQAAEELVKAAAHLGAASDVKAIDSNLASSLEGLFVATTKLSMIADKETANAVAKLESFYTTLQIKVMEKIFPIRLRMSDIDFTTDALNKTDKEIEIISEKYKLMIETENTELYSRESLSFELDELLNRSSELNNKIELLWDEFNELQNNFSEFILDEMLKVSDLQVPVFIAIRKELGLDAYTDEYRILYEKQGLEARAAMSSFKLAIQKEINRKH
jgi:hypothetical protein